jgi:thioredoxin-related protein
LLNSFVGGKRLKRAGLLIITLFLLAPGAFATPWVTSLATAQKKAKESKRLIFVDLFADWCGWCHRMEQEVFPSQTFQNATDKMVLLRLNTEDQGEGTKLSQRFAVTSLPTFLILTHDDMVAGIIRGYAPSTEFVKAMNEALTKYSDFQKRVSQEPSFANDPQKRLDLAREFTSRFGLSQSEARLKKLTLDKGVPEGVRDQAWYEMAVSQMMQQRQDDAIKTIAAFAKVQNKGQSYELSRFLLAQIYTQKGNMLMAANELRSLKAKFPNTQLMRNIEIMLPSIERQLSQK